MNNQRELLSEQQRLHTRLEKERARRAAETAEQREARLRPSGESETEPEEQLNMRQRNKEKPCWPSSESETEPEEQLKWPLSQVMREKPDYVE